MLFRDELQEDYNEFNLFHSLHHSPILHDADNILFDTSNL